MTFDKAFEIAIKNKEFEAHAKKVENCKSKMKDSGCLQFSIADEAFYYGFDGCRLFAGKHTSKRSAYLIKAGKTLVIQ